MKKLLSICLAMMSLAAVGQGRFSVLLQSGTYELTEGNLQNQLISKTPGVVDGQFFRLVQYYETPSMGQQKKLETTGVKILSYLPKNSFLMSFPVGYSLSADDAKLIRAITPFTSQMKLSKNLMFKDFPEYAVEGNNVKIVAHFYEVFTAAEENSFLLSISNGIGGTYAMKDEHIFEGTLSRKNWEKLKTLPFIYYLQEGEDPGEAENFKARTSHRVDAIASNTPNGYGLRGAGVRVSLGDVGPFGPHIDYTGRLQFLATSTGGSTHGAHTAGTVFAAGNLDPDGAGMAPEANLTYYSYPANLNNVDADYVSKTVRITSSSFSNGCNTYTSFSSIVDKDIYENEKLIHVFSAGNSGTTNCGYGAGSNWGNITGGHKQGKNVVTVANFTTSDGLAPSSSRGPAHDGRVKPDIGGVGTNVYSTWPNNSYNNLTGTSMSCPGVAGTLALIYQGYKKFNNGTDPDGGLAKAIILNTAEDLGNKHVDFKHGYGRINAYRAMQCIEDDNIFIDSISTGDTNTHTVTVPAGTKEVRIMVYWTDKQATANASRALVNNLDMVITHGIHSYKPWILDPTANTSSLNSVAVQGIDSLNNAEQFTLENPLSGAHTVTITGTNVPVGPQKYYVVYTIIKESLVLMTPFGGESWNPMKDYSIRWDITGGSGGTSLAYSIDNGTNWTSIVNNISSSIRTYVWNIPNGIVSDKALVRAIRGSDTSICATNFSIIRTPVNLKVEWGCPDSTKISWNPVPGVTGYVVHQLGTKYMDSVGTTTQTSFVLQNINPNKEYWFSVSSLDSSGNRGERAIAIRRQLGTFNCSLTNDVSLEAIISPSPGVLKSCLNLSTVEVQVEIKNNGTATQSSVPINIKLNQGAVIQETYSSSLAPGASATFTFSATLNLTAGTQNLTVWTALPNDQNGYNDTLVSKVIVQAGIARTVPYFQNFDIWGTCATVSNCEAGVCNLIQGWNNERNLISDDIDFRTNSGGTPSNGTGPTGDHTTGSGKYIYLEASVCFEKIAKAQTPCIIMPATGNNIELSFWYHMGGTSMGVLSVDILYDGKTDLDVAVIAGNQGFNWKEKKVSLTKYLGKTITVGFRGKTGISWTSDISIDDVSIKEASGIGIGENDFSQFISVSPNPANENISINWDGKNNKDAKIVIVNTMGQTILEDNWSGDLNKEYQISDWARGVYFIHITYNNQRKVIKFVKQ